MMDTEAFREFKTGLTLLRDRRAAKALPHMRRAVELDKNNPYYMSYLGVVLARSEGKWGEAQKLCDSAVRMKRNQAQLYLNLAEVYAAAGRREDAREALESGLKFARRDVRLTIAINKLTGKSEQLPEIVSRGFVSFDDGSDILRDAREVVRRTVDSSSNEERSDWGVMQEKVRADLKRFLIKQTSRRPLIVPVILEV